MASTEKIHRNDSVILVLGPTGSGRSQFIESAVQDPTVQIARESMQSYTQDITPYRLSKRPGTEVYDETVVLVDTPGFDHSSRDDKITLSIIANWLKQQESLQVLAGVLWFHRITDDRMNKTAIKNLDMFFHWLCGFEAAQTVVFVTTMWDLPTLGQSAEANLQDLQEEYWQEMIQKGAKIAKFDKLADVSSAWSVIIPLASQHKTRKSLRPVEELSRSTEFDKHMQETKRGRIFKRKFFEFIKPSLSFKSSTRPQSTLDYSTTLALHADQCDAHATEMSSRPSSIYSITRIDITTYTVTILQHAIDLNWTVPIPGFSALLELGLSVVRPVQEHWPEERSLGYPLLYFAWFILAVENYTKYGCCEKSVKDVCSSIPSFTCAFQPLLDIITVAIGQDPIGQLRQERIAINACNEKITIACLSLAAQIESDLLTLHLLHFDEDPVIRAIYERVSEGLQVELINTKSSKNQKDEEVTTSPPQLPLYDYYEDRIDQLLQLVSELGQRVEYLENALTGFIATERHREISVSSGSRILIMGGNVNMVVNNISNGAEPTSETSLDTN